MALKVWASRVVPAGLELPAEVSSPFKLAAERQNGGGSLILSSAWDIL